jgi:hypothetical protein
MPPKSEWNSRPPRSADGRLHPDVYWYGVILDMRAPGPKKELWLKVSWYYSKGDLEALAQGRPDIRHLLRHPYVISPSIFPHACLTNLQRH